MQILPSAAFCCMQQKVRLAKQDMFYLYTILQKKIKRNKETSSYASAKIKRNRLFLFLSLSVIASLANNNNKTHKKQHLHIYKI